MISSADDLFQEELQKLYSVETQLIQALPQIQHAAQSDELRNAIEDHIDETKKQAERLESLGADMDIKFDGKEDKVLKTLLEEGKKEIEEIDNPRLVDTVIISGSDKVEHYEMAAYESAMALAKQLGMDEVADTLKETYEEEKKTSELLSGMTKGGMSEFAAQVK